MQNFNARMFNPPADPSAHLGIQQSVEPQNYYRYELKNVMVTSYQTSGSD